MPSTYTLISSNVLSSSAASVTFSAIPSTYTDLVLRGSARTSITGQTFDNLTLKFNGSGGTAYSYIRLRGSGSAASSSIGSGVAEINFFAAADAADATANTFSNFEIYVPSYAVAQFHPVGSFQVQEDNATAANITTTAGLWSSASAITSMTFASVNAANFVSGSSFYLYGIKNS